MAGSFAQAGPGSHLCDLCGKTYLRGELMTSLRINKLVDIKARQFSELIKKWKMVKPWTRPTQRHTLITKVKTMADRLQLADLLGRHRRRCDPRKAASKRRSCRSCIQAKTRCSLEQPACSRCLGRGVACVYDTSNTVLPADQARAQNHTGTITPQSQSSSDHDVVLMGDSWNVSDLPVSWTQSLVDQSQSWESDGRSLSTLTGMPTQSIMDVTDAETSVLLDAQIPIPADPWALQIDPQVAAFAQRIPVHPSPALSEQSVSSIFDERTPISAFRRYTERLVSSDYQTPLLHRELYLRATPDITTLPRTSASLCCISSATAAGTRAFARRVAAAEQIRIAQSFHKQSCIAEWDHLHAAWIYEILSLLDPDHEKDSLWRLGTTMSGVNTTLLVKMCRRFCQSHPDIGEIESQEPFIRTASHELLSSRWIAWSVAETARRTIFCLNILNWLIGRALADDGSESIYYEAIDNELILNMPLPAPPECWLAASCTEWRDAMLFLSDARRLDPTHSVLQNPGNGVTLKMLLDRYSVDHIRSATAGQANLDDSLTFRNLIILCALQQFS